MRKRNSEYYKMNNKIDIITANKKKMINLNLQTTHFNQNLLYSL